MEHVFSSLITKHEGTKLFYLKESEGCVLGVVSFVN